MISIVVLTHNRQHLLQQCVNNVLDRVSDLTSDIIIWNNASSDGTAEYLATQTDRRIRVINHPENVGQNAYARAFDLTDSPFLIELDDDMIDAPPEWDRSLLEAYERLPSIGFLAANLVDNPHDQAARIMYHERPHLYSEEEINGVVLLRGPVGGGCAVTSRDLYERVGGFQQRGDQVFWLEDEAYVADIEKLGFGAAYLKDLKLLHAGGAYYAPESDAKHQFWRAYWTREIRKNAVKRLLLRVPFVRPLNERYNWFQLSDTPDF